MLLTKLAAASVLAGSASAKLLMGSFPGVHNGLYQAEHQHAEQRGQTGHISVAEASPEQRPLAGGPDVGGSEYIDQGPFKAGQFTLTPQDGTVCASYGESQWTGTIDVTDSRRLFFAAFESRNDPENDPVIFWMNGGPGGSSTEGNFVEMGPCWLDEGANKTVPNKWSWNNNATVVFLDQPAGVGLSTVADGAYKPSTDMDGAEDFQAFLNVFFSKVFPSKVKLPIIISAESYGGHYGPTYLSHILESRRYGSATAFRGNITGLVLIDAVIDFAGPFLGLYKLLCEEERGKGIISEESCEQMRLQMPECERLGTLCDVAVDGIACNAMFEHCAEYLLGPYFEKVQAGERSLYHIHRSCPQYPGECQVPGSGNISAFINQPHIKEALKLSPSFEFSPVDLRLTARYQANYAVQKPTSGLLSSILDAYRTTTFAKETEHLADIKVLVLNGNEDAVVNTYGNMWQHEKVLWSGQAEYRAANWRQLEEDELAATGTWKATRDGRMAFVAVDGAGHMVPGDVREGSYRILQKWLQGSFHF